MTQQPASRKWLAPGIVIALAGGAGLAFNLMRSKPIPTPPLPMSAAPAADEFVPTVENKDLPACTIT